MARTYREISMAMTDFKRMLATVVGSADFQLTWMDYSEGYWVSEMVTPGYLYGLSSVRVKSISSKGVKLWETCFDCEDEASPREARGGAVVMDGLRDQLGPDIVPDDAFVLEAVLRSGNSKSVLYLFIKDDGV